MHQSRSIMRRSGKSKSFVLGLAVAPLLAGILAKPAKGQVVWNTPVTVGANSYNGTDVFAAGTLQYGYNFSGTNETINGVLLTGTTSQGALGTNTVTLQSSLNGNYTGFLIGNGAPGSNLPAAYQQALTGGDYNTGAGSATVTLNNLITGHQYAVQSWVNDSRNGEQTRTETISSINGNTQTLAYNSTQTTGGVGQYSIGTFTAAGATQVYSLLGNSSTQINAVQLQDVTNIGYWQGSSGNWDQSTTTNFSTTTSGTPGTFAAAVAVLPTVYFGNTQTLGGTAVGTSTVTVGGASGSGVTGANVFFINTSAAYSLTNGTGVTTGIAGAANSVWVQGGGQVTFNSANTYGGGTSISNGGLTINNAGSLGSGGVTVYSTGTLNINIGATTIANTFSGSGGGIINVQGAGETKFSATSLSGFAGTINILTTSDTNTSLTAKMTLLATSDSPTAAQIINIGNSSTSTATLYDGGSAAFGSNVAINIYGAGNGEGFGALRLDGGSVAGSVTLETSNATIGVSTGSTGTISGAIGGSGSLNKVGGGTLVLSGANTFGGPITIQGGAGPSAGNTTYSALSLNYGSSGATINNVLYNGNATPPAITLGGPLVTLQGTTVVTAPLGGGKLTLNGAASTTNSQTFGGLVVNPGDSTVTTNSGASGTFNLTLGAITANTGGFVNFVLPASGSVTTTTANASISSVSTGILGGYATVSGKDWAASAGTGSVAGAISAYAGYTPASGAIATGSTTNVQLTGTTAGAYTSASGTSINTIQYGNTGTSNSTLTLTGTTTLGPVGGIMMPSNTASSLTITGGTLSAGGPTTGTPGELFLIVNASRNPTLSISSTIADNGAGAVTVIDSGNGEINISGNNSYSGGTYVNQGRVNSTTSTAYGTGNVYLAAGAQIYTVGGTLANSFFISGDGGNDAADAALRGALRIEGSTISGPVTLVANATVGSTGGTGTISGAIQGDYNFGIDRAGAGVIVLGGSNTYGGSTTIYGGTLQINTLANAGTTIALTTSANSTAVTLSNTGGLANGTTYAVSGPNTAGATTFTYNNANGVNQTLSTAAIATGTANAQVGTANALGLSTNLAGNLVLASGNGNPALSFGGSGSVSTDRLFGVNNGITATINDNSSSNGALNFTNTGAMGFNSTTGTRTLALAGTSTGASTMAVLIADSGSGSGNFTSLTKGGSGAWALTNANTYSGGTTVSSGTLDINNGSAGVTTGSAIGLGTLTLGGGVAIDATVSGITLGTNNPQTWNGSFSYGGTNSLNLGAGAVTITGNAGTAFTETLTANAANAGTTLTIGGTITEAAAVTTTDTLAFAGPGNVALNGIISNGVGSNAVMALSMAGRGTVTLGAANTYTGNTTITSGVLQLGHVNAVQNSTVTTSGNGALKFSAGITTPNIGALAGSGNITLQDQTTPTALAVTLSAGGNNASTTYAGVLSGSGGLTKAGSGVQLLTNANTYLGATTISGGTLRLQVANPVSAGVLYDLDASNSANYTLTGSNVTTWKDSSGTNNNFTYVQRGSSTISNGPTVATGAIDGKNALNFNGSQALTLANSTTPVTVFLVNTVTHYNGNIDGIWGQVGDFGIREYNSSGWGNGSLGNGGDYTTSGTMYVNGVQIATNAYGPFTVGTAENLEATNSSPGTWGSTGIGEYGTGGAANRFFTGNIGEVLAFSTTLTTAQQQAVQAYLNYKWLGIGTATNILPTTTTVSMSNGSTLDLNGFSQTVASLSSADPTTKVTLGGAVFTVGNSSNTTFAGVISDTGGASASTGGILVKTGSGALALTATNTYGGGTQLNGGTLNINADAALGTVPGSPATNITFTGNSTLQFAAASAFNLSANRNIAINPGVTGAIDTNNNSTTIASVIGGSGGLTVINSAASPVGSLTLSNTGNNYSGATTIATAGNPSGTLNLTGVLGNTTVTVNSGGVLTGAGDNSTTGLIGGSVTVNGGGVVTLAAGNSAQALTVHSGLTLGNAGSYVAGSYATLNYTLGPSGLEAIDLGPVASLTGVLTLNSSGAYVNITGTPPALGNYTLLNFASQTGGGAFSLSSTTAGVTSVHVGVDTYALTDNSTSLVLNITGTPVPGAAYFKGGVSTIWNDASAAPITNWSLDSAGAHDAGNTPGANTDVILTAGTPAGTGTVATTLGASTTINSLNVNANAASNTINTDGSTLTINALLDTNTDFNSSYTGNPSGTGIKIAGGAGALTINVPVILGGSGAGQAWTNASGNLFTVAGAITGTATTGNTQNLTLINSGSGGITISGLISDVSAGGRVGLVVNNTNSGVTTLSNSGNSYSAGTTLNGGTLTSAVTGGFGLGFVTVNPTNATSSSPDNAILNTTNSIATNVAVTVNSESSDGGFGIGTINFNGASEAIASLAGNGNVVLNNSGGTTLSINYAGGTTDTFSGKISSGAGTGSLTKTATGVLSLTGINTYTGATNINGGTLAVNTGGSISSAGLFNVGGGTAAGTLTIAGGSVADSNNTNFAFCVGNGSNGTFNISSGSLNVSAGLSGVLLGNSGTAAWNQTGGTVTVAGGFGIYAGNNPGGATTMTISGGSLTATVGNVNLGVRDNTTLTISNSAIVTFGPMVIGYGTGGVANTSSVTLGDGINFTGGTNINNGGTSGVLVTFAVLKDIAGPLAGQVSNFNFNGGTLKATGINAAFMAGLDAANVNASGGIIDNGGFAIGIPQALLHGAGTPDGGIVFQGVGATTLGGSNTYTGPTNVQNGTVVLTGSLPAGISLTLGSGGNSGAFQLGSGSAVNLTVASLQTAGSATGGDAVLGGASAVSTLTVANTSADVYGGTLGGGGANQNNLALTLAATASNVLTLNSANTYTGPTTITSGVLQLGHANAVQNSTVSVNVNGGLAFATGITAPVIGALGGSGNISLQDATTPIALPVTPSVGGNNASTTYSGALSGSGGLTKAGSGTMLMTNASTYQGATNITGGTLQLGINVLPVTTGLLYNVSAANSANYSLSGSFVTQWKDLSGNNNNFTYAARGNSTSGPTVVAGAINGRNAFFFNGAQALTMNNSSSPKTIFIVDTVTHFNNSIDGIWGEVGDIGIREAAGPAWYNGSLANGNDYTNAGTMYINGTQVASNANGSITLNTAQLLEATNANPPGAPWPQTGLGEYGTGNAGNRFFTGYVGQVIAYNGVLTTTQRQLVEQYLQNAWLQTSVAGNILPITTAVSLSNSSKLDLAGNSQTIGSLSSSDPTTSVTLGGAVLTIGNGNNTIFAGIISDAGGALGTTGGQLIYQGTGSLTLSGTNTYSGGTIINAGTLTAQGASALGATTGPLQVNNPNNGGDGTNVVLNLSATSPTTTGSLSGTITPITFGSDPNTVTINTQTGQAFTVNQTTPGTYAGAIAGGGSFTLGTGTTAALTLTGSNTYTGGTTVKAGTLLVNTSSPTSSGTGSGAVTVSGGRLGGTGYILNNPGSPVSINAGGTISPGPDTNNTVGTLTTGDQTWNGGTYLFKTNLATNPGQSFSTLNQGSAQDFLVVNGNLDIVTGAQFTIAIDALGAAPTIGSTFTVAYANNIYTEPTVGGALTPVTTATTFAFPSADFNVPDNYGSVYDISFVADAGGPNGNGLDMVVTVAPEPGSLGLLALASLGLLRRRRVVTRR